MQVSDAPVAQLDRALLCGRRGCRFESCLAYLTSLLFHKLVPPREEKENQAYKKRILVWIEKNALETDGPIDTTKIIRKMRDEE